MANEKKKKVDETIDSENDKKSCDNENDTKTWNSEWMIRPCDVYKEEYNDCTSFRGRFQQNFVYGEKLDCSQWKIDYENCKKWKKSNDEKTYDELLTSEKLRRLERLRPHYKNDVWQKRDEPPSDWNAPLPDWLVKRNQGTFLALKQDDIENNKNTSVVLMPGCNIL